MTFSNKPSRRLAVFDVEGVILPKRRYLLLQATKRLNFLKILNLVFLGALYEVGFFTLERAFKGIYQLFAGVSKEEFYQTFKSISIIPEVRQVFQKLKANGYEIALISSGLPDFLVEELARQLGANYAHGFKLEIVNNKLTGRISGDVISANGKAIILERILKAGNYSKDDCIVVADDRNNLPMLSLCGKTIGYNPDMFLASKCDYTIKGNLRDIIPFLETPVKTPRAPYTRTDLYREIIHMGSFLIPVLCQFFNFDRYMIAVAISATTIIYAFSELARRAGVDFPPFTTVTNLVAIGDERWEFATAPIFFAVGIVFPLTFYPTKIGFAAITILTLGDGIARMVGKTMGQVALPYNKAKKLEGTMAGILLSALASLLFVSPLEAVAASIIGMIVESLPLPISDNMVIPLAAGLTIMVIP